MPAKFGLADELLLAQISRRWLLVVTDRREMVPAGMSAPVVVPIGADSQNVIEVPFADDTKAVQDLVLERLDDSLDKRL